MRNYYLLLFLLFGIFANAQNKAVIISSSEDTTVIDFSFQSYQLKTVTTPQGQESILVAENMSAIMKEAAPDLPKYTESIIIPDLASMDVEVLESDYTDLQDISIAPSKGNLLRTVNPDDVAYTYGAEYEKNTFYPGQLATLNTPYIMRDYRGQTVQVFPYQYNPVSKVLRVYSNIKLKISVKDNKGINPFNRNRTIDKISKEFKKIYSSHFINFENLQSRYTPLEEEGNMLVICYDDWTSYMEDFVTWKNTIGRPCEMVTVTDAGGTAENIKTYVENYYNTNGLTYLLLVGDSDQVPTNSGGGLGGHSDNAYGYITGSDHYQELFVGRFSAEDPLHVMTQSLRTIEYEKGDQLAADWLNKLMSVGSDQGPGDDGEMDYEHLRNIQTDLLSFTYLAPPYEHFDGSQGGEDAAGDPSPADVAADLNTGVGIVNYTGHGSTTSWGSSGFSVSDINSLTNDNKLPFIWSVACVNGAFVGNTCFGEAWLRAENATEPTGAIAILASTINQSWAPPMIGQDEMNDLLVGTAANGTKRTFAGLSINGCFQMIEESSDFAMIDTWTCFGDPSVYVRTDNPVDMVISHNSEIIVGETVFNVSCDLDGALATISNDGVIMGSALVSGGVAAVPVSGLVPGTTLKLAVVGFNKITYLNDIMVIAPAGSYLVVDSYENTITFGTSKDLDIAIKNVGVDDAVNVNVTATTTDANASFTNNTYSYGTIAAGAISPASSGAFSLSVSDDVPDQYIVSIDIEMTDDTDTWNVSKNVVVNAPAITINTLTIDDTATGNGDSILDPGETATLIIQATNSGHADVTNVISVISSTSTDLTINTATAPTASLNAGATGDFEFSVTADAATAPGTPANLTNDITAGTSNQYNAQKEFTIIIGFVPEYCSAGSNNSNDEFIQQVVFEDIDNTSTIGASYTDYTNISTDVEVGNTYPITIINGSSWSSDQMGCWVDWNYDGDFEDMGEYFVIDYAHDTPSSGLGTGTGSVIVPADARLGVTTMRLRLLYTGDILPCGNTSYGEVEDYSINVTNPYLSVDDNNLSNINVYPNPNVGIFTIDLRNVNNEVNLELYNLNGQLIYQEVTSQKLFKINTNEKSGVYFLRMTSGNQVINKKIIITK